MKEILVELTCDKCGKRYMRSHVHMSKDLIGSSYCSECFNRLMGRYKK